MYFKRWAIGLAVALALAGCIEETDYNYTYSLRGSIKNVVNLPVSELRVIFYHSIYAQEQADTVYTDAQGQYEVSLRLTSKQRVFICDFTDLSNTYRDSTLRISYQDVTPEQQGNEYVYTLTQDLVLPRHSQSGL